MPENRLTAEDWEWVKKMEANSGHEFKTAPNELDYCERCGGYEGGLTTHCPGTRVSFDLSQKVYHGEIDFRDGRWVNQPTTAMAHAYGIRREPCIEVDPSAMLNSAVAV